MKSSAKEKRRPAPSPPRQPGCRVFLAREDSSHMTGQVLHRNGVKIIHG